MKWDLILQYSKQMPNHFHSLRTPVEAEGLNYFEELKVHKEESHQCEDEHVFIVYGLVIK